jgi:hypothetical protein
MYTLQEKFATDELIILTVAPSVKARMRTAELLAQAFALPQA